ncbi:Tetratricopeptide-like helical domain superfamily [Sesbania bispinosa]|nr:Tetratricopeptide-like helical domain superfamily [Sesbania bispinosa]
MIEAGVTPNSSTFISVSKAAGKLGDINKCHEVYRYASECGLHCNTSVGTALIDMYSKCGALSDAQVLFDSRFNGFLVNTPWNAMITDVYTFCCVFNSIAALKCLKSLKETHRMALKCGFDLMKISASNSLADAYCKCESLEAGEKTLLGACRIHGNAELGEIAAQKILSTLPEYPSAYILLSNTYIDSGLHKDGVSLRDVMKERGIRKEPGYSWISVRGEVDKFFAGDQQHPQKDKIYTMLQDYTMNIMYMNYEQEFN